MAEIRYYRSGEHDPVGAAGTARGASHSRRGTPLAVRRGRLRVAVALLLLLIATVCLALVAGRQAFTNVFAILSVVGHLRRLPHWTPYAVALATCGAIVVGAYSLAFVRRRVFKVVCVALLIALFAAPGVALGWTSGFVGQMGRGGSAEQKAAVTAALTVLQHPLPNRPVNILLLGTDENSNSDSQILVRLDPQAKTISMLSLPRDLRWNIPGIGYAKMNAAYNVGGVKLAVQTFSAITGLPINHFIRVDFNGFWHIVDVLHGVYLPVDHRYYNPEGTGFQPINVQPGYQLLKAKQALAFVRYRHDQNGDFTRMVRQQMFLRAVQQQAMRWSGSWTKVVSLVTAVSHLTTTDLDSLSQLLPIINMGLTLNTSHLYQVHVEGSTPTIGGVDYVVASPAQIAAAVRQFENPVTRDAHRAASAVAQASASPSTSPSTNASSTTATSSSAGAAGAQQAQHQEYDWSAWRTLARHTSLTLEAPTTWAPTLGYDTAGVPFRAYSLQTPDKHRVKAAIAVGTVGGGSGSTTEYWGVQALAWADPPAIANPNSTRTIGGRTYLLFNQDKSLHMVAWHENGDTYWVVNTLDNLLSNQLMLALAESCQPVGR